VGWWERNIVEPGKLPLLLCLAAFIGTFLITRLITRSIRAGRGPFKDNVTSSGTHVHHAVPGILLLVAGALVAISTPQPPWVSIGAVAIGVGMSLVLDEFALILHLQDVYWSSEGRLSVEVIGFTAAVMGFGLVGLSPNGVDQLSAGELGVRLSLTTVVAVHAALAVVTVLKGKYRTALLSCFIPFIAWVAAFRLARPGSWWARRWYGERRLARAGVRARAWDARWDPRWDRLSDLVAGRPTARVATPGPAPAAPDADRSSADPAEPR
jgi:hypothetical protein